MPKKKDSSSSQVLFGHITCPLGPDWSGSVELPIPFDGSDYQRAIRGLNSISSRFSEEDPDTRIDVLRNFTMNFSSLRSCDVSYKGVPITDATGLSVPLPFILWVNKLVSPIIQEAMDPKLLQGG